MEITFLPVDSHRPPGAGPGSKVEGPWVDSTVGLTDVRADIAMLRTPDGHGRVELTKFHSRRRSDPSRAVTALRASDRSLD